MNPPAAKVEEAPKVVSDPNHVAKRAVVESMKGRRCPARAKSPELWTLELAQMPIPMEISR